MGRDFQTFLHQLEAAGELRRVAVEVDPFLEMGAVADRVSKEPGGGKALLFERAKGSALPVAMNVYGSLKRMEMALGVDREPRGLDAIADRIEGLMKEVLPRPGLGFLEKLSKLPMLLEVAGWLPKTVKKGLCQEIVLTGADAKLSRRPLHHPGPEPPALQGRPAQHGPLPPPGLRRPHLGLPHPASPRRRPGSPRLCPR